MIYPKHIVEKYKGVKYLEETLEIGKDRNYYDKEKAIAVIEYRIEQLLDSIYEEAAIYAAESGADRDGGYDPDRVLDDLESQLGE
jgi:hypothetical protein